MTKTCNMCEDDKSVSEFLPYSGRGKVRAYCRPCHNERFRAYGVAAQLKRRRKALTLLGDKCVGCGFSDPRALQFDHIAGDGAADRKRWGGAVPQRVVSEILLGSTRFQILCANCNWIKRHENREYGRGADVAGA